eukprot:scaffold2269_cov149-Skeletonema_menzelii.AAC.14
MADPRMSFRSTGAHSLYSVDEEEEMSYYEDEEEFFDDEEEYYDDDEQYSPGGGRDRYNKSAMSNTNRYSGNNRGDGGGRELVEYDADDYDSYADDHYDDRGRGGGGGGGRGRGGGRQRAGNGNNYKSRSSSNRRSRNNSSGGERKLVSILPGTPKQAQDIIRQYSLGMSLKYATHMALPPTTPPEGPAREIATLQVANLVPQEYAFVRRSNGQWCFAQLAVRHDSLEQMVFIVNKGGSTKTFKRFEWPGFVRRIKWTERRVQLTKPLNEMSNGNAAIEGGTSGQPLALENGGGPTNKSASAPQNNPAQPDKPQQPEVSTMTIKEMKIELQQLGIDFSLFMEKQEFRNAVIDARAEAVKNALIREQQMQRHQQEEEQQQQQHQNQHNNDGFENFDEINLNSNLDADLSNLAGQIITLQPMQDDEVSELMGDYLLTEYKFQMKVLERERLKKQNAANKMASINEHGSGNGNLGDGQQSSAYQSGLGQQSSAYQSFNIEGEGERKLPHYEKQAFAKSQKWGSVSEEV